MGGTKSQTFQVKDEDFEGAVAILENLLDCIQINYDVKEEIVNISVICNSKQEAKKLSETLKKIFPHL